MTDPAPAFAHPMPAPRQPAPAAATATAPRPTRPTRRQRLLSWLGQLAAAAAVLAAAHFWQTRHIPSGPAPQFSAPAVASQPGAQMSLAQWQAAHPGRPVALHFWAEWCSICRLEQHNITRISRDWPVLTVAMRSGDAAAVQHTLAQRGLDWATVTDPDATLARQYGLGSVPALIVISPDGHIRASSVGYTTELGMRLRLWWAGLFRQA